jgi:hypothetical protein
MKITPRHSQKNKPELRKHLDANITRAKEAAKLVLTVDAKKRERRQESPAPETHRPGPRTLGPGGLPRMTNTNT